MILKTPPFEDIVSKCHQQIGISAYKNVLELVGRMAHKEGIRDKLWVKNGFVCIDTDMYKTSEIRDYLEINEPFTRVWKYALDDKTIIVLSLNYSLTIREMWELVATRQHVLTNQSFSIRVPLLRKDGRYAGAAEPEDTFRVRRLRSSRHPFAVSPLDS